MINFKKIYLDEVNSTHSYLKKYIENYGYIEPVAIITKNQTDGIGSRNNCWDGVRGNLFFSFVLKKSLLPDDLPLQSTSIYFSFIFKDILNKLGSKVWLKWPNDFYIYNQKIGGTITNYSKGLCFCGIGLNLINTKNTYSFLDIEVKIKEILNLYFVALEKKLSWKHIFSKYLIEFEKSKQLKTTIDDQKILMKDAILNGDGSIFIDNKKVYSLR